MVAWQSQRSRRARRLRHGTGRGRRAEPGRLQFGEWVAPRSRRDPVDTECPGYNPWLDVKAKRDAESWGSKPAINDAENGGRRGRRVRRRSRARGRNDAPRQALVSRPSIGRGVVALASIPPTPARAKGGSAGRMREHRLPGRQATEAPPITDSLVIYVSGRERSRTHFFSPARRARFSIWLTYRARHGSIR